jgi:hypothetical protein
LKLLSKDEKTFTFLIGKKERELMYAILRKYPMIIAAHFKDRHAGKDSKSGHDELIQEALAEQQKENKRQLEEMLAQPGRFAEEELGFRFALTHSEMEWLLQLLNDVRVGSWIQLGEPDGNSNIFGPEQKLTEQTIQLAWTMEMAGHFLSGLLEAYKTADS